MKRCLACRSLNVNRSFLSEEEAASHPLQSPYRCAKCNTRFWVISRKTRMGAVVASATALTAILLVMGGQRLLGHGEPPSAPVTANVLSPNDLYAIGHARLAEQPAAELTQSAVSR